MAKPQIIEFENTVVCETALEWRKWLEINHKIKSNIWLNIYKKQSKIASVYYSEAVDEALCFGWIDSQPAKRDNLSYYVYFSERNPKSNWSLVNKQKVERLLELNKIEEKGLEMIRIAKETGTWNALDKVDNLELPFYMEQLLENNSIAKLNWEHFPNSVKKGILEWIYQSKRESTLHNRITETVTSASQNIRIKFSK